MASTPEDRETDASTTETPVADALEQLREKEQQYRSIFEATNDAILIVSPDNVVVETNGAASRLWGFEHDEMIGQRVRVLNEEILESIRVHGYHVERGINLHKDGREVYIEGRVSPFSYGGKPHYLAVTRDITQQMEAQTLLEQRVAERTRELSALLEVSHNVTSTLELQPLLGLILDATIDLTASDGAALLSLEADDLTVLARRAPSPPATPMPERYTVQAHGVIWEVLSAGNPMIIDDVRGADEPARAYQALVGSHLDGSLGFEQSFMAVPMRLKDRLVGLLALSSAKVGYFTPRHATLAHAIAQQAAIAIENARLYGAAQEVAVLEERQRLSRELHDSVSQALYGIALSTRTALALLDRDPARAVEPVQFALTQAETGLAEMRALIFELRPEALEQHGLVVGLEHQSSVLANRHGLTIRAELTEEPDVPFVVKEALYRIAQEALHNAVKHARADAIDLRLWWQGRDLTLEVQDSGQGFDPAGDFPGHLGLRSMQERAARLGARLAVQSAPGQGTLVRVRLPATQPAPTKG